MKDVSFFVGYLGFASSVVICGHGRHEQEKQWSVLWRAIKPRTTTSEPVLPSPCAATREATAMRSPRTTTKSSPPLRATSESPTTATKTQCNQN